MLRARTVLVLAVLVFLGFGLLLRNDTEGDIRPEPGIVGADAMAAPTVEVEHTLVTADVVAAPRLARPRAPGPSATRPAVERRVAAANSRPMASSNPTSLASKTRRVILGDGRHKPQPFPRANNN